MSLFTQILKRYESVDTSYGTDKNTSHSYGDTYNTLFKPYRDTASSILEIGFDGGHSLLAYYEYFNNANIYGIDIRDNCRVPIHSVDRFHLHFGDATLPENVNVFNTKFDIIIEDASHLPEHQIQHFKDFSPLVKSGGLYIIEDVYEGFYKNICDTLKPIAEQNKFTMEVIDLRHKKKRNDDILIVFRAM